jgi:hypothetical protein
MEDARDYAYAHFKAVDQLPGAMAAPSWNQHNNKEQVCTMAAWLQVRRMPNVKWRHVLNNHTTNRPTELQPNLVRCLEDHLTSSLVTGHGTGEWRTELQLPHSFDHGDGRSHTLVATGASKTQSVANVCWLAFTVLVLSRPERVRILPNHWMSTTVQEVIAEAQQTRGRPVTAANAPLPGHAYLHEAATPHRRPTAYEAPEPGPAGAAARLEEVREHLRAILQSQASGWLGSPELAETTPAADA